MDIITSIEGDSSMDSESEESVAEKVDMVATTAEQASLIAKLQELQALKEEAVAKYNRDDAVVKRVLSLM
jgi:hypothetical protein